jgi:hypothetical protein
MLCLPHARDDEDVLSFPEVPSIVAGYGAYIVDHIRRVNRDPDIGIISDLYHIEIDLGFHLRVSLPYPLSHLLSRTTNCILFLASRAHGLFLLPDEPIAPLYHGMSTTQG